MKSVRYIIAITPPTTIQKKAIALSRRMSEQGGFFSLGTKETSPHLTLYMAEIPVGRERTMVDGLKKMAANIRPIRLDASRYRDAGRGYADILYRRNAAAAKLQKEIIAVLRLFDIAKAKYSSIGKKYHPHLTLTRLPNNRKADFKGMPRPTLSFTAREIDVYVQGDHGTAKKLVAKFSL